MSMTFNDGTKDGPGDPIQFSDLVHQLGDKFKNQHVGTDKVVFVDFEDGVQWKTVLSVMDTIRSLASDNAPPDDNHNEIKVALKIKGADAPDNAPK
jgi:hypothetical protein